MKNIFKYNRIYTYVLISILMLGIGTFACLNNNSLAITYGDAECNAYGISCRRIHNSRELISSFEKILTNYQSGTFHFISDQNVDYINRDEFINWLNSSKYVLDDYNRNVYSYDEKGEYEPIRFKYDDSLRMGSNFAFTFNSIRTTGERKTKGEYMANILKNKLNDGETFNKIYNVYHYIKNTTVYNNDLGKPLIESETDIYATYINRRADCIGVSIAFAYLMKLYGIETYIVDNVNYVNPNNKTASSTHTWNIVKLDDKFYKLDITGGVFLGAVSNNEIHGRNYNLSHTDYEFSFEELDYMMNRKFDFDSVKSDISKAKTISAPQATTVNIVHTSKIEEDKIKYDDYYDKNSTVPAENDQTKKFIVTKNNSSETREATTSEGMIPFGSGEEKTSKAKITEVFTSVASKDGTTKVINYKVDEDGNYVEISKEEASKIKKANKQFKLTISTKQKNFILAICILFVFVLIVIQIVKRVKYKKGSGYTTFTFYVDK